MESHMNDSPHPVPRGTRNAPIAGPHIIAIANQKGGVGKTTTAVNLAASLAHQGSRVLVIDSDPQGNATSGFGIDKAAISSCLYDALIHGKPLTEIILRTAIAGLDIVPATMQLAGAELILAERDAREFQLRELLIDVAPWYDYVIIDCPPSLSLITINALVAATSMIVPVQAEFYSLEGLAQVVSIIERIRNGLNANLMLAGLLVTMFDGRTRLALDVLAELEQNFGETVFATRIPRTIRLSEAPSFGKPILQFDPKSRGAAAYLDLATELERVLRRRRHATGAATVHSE
jgi:chromosome partitioning protein